MRQTRSANLRLLLTLASCLLLTAAAAHAEHCPREVELKFSSTPDTGLSANRFLDEYGSSFFGHQVTLTTGLAEPDYVLAVAYSNYEVEGEKHGYLTLALCFTGGTVGEPVVIGGTLEPIVGYGQDLRHAEFWGKDVMPETLETVVAEFAADIPEVIRSNDRIPESGRIELPRGCYRPNEARVISAFVPPGPYTQGKVGTDVQHRILVRAEHGDIRNGVAWEEDERTRVFLLHAERDIGEIKLDYIAPIGFESDHLTIWSSCDVSHPPVKHPSTAEKHEIIAEADITICQGYRLEYAHEFTIEHDAAMLLYTLTGEVLLRLTEPIYEGDRIIGGKLMGSATLPVLMAGNFRDCTVTYTNQMSVEVTGEIRRGAPEAGQGPLVVQVELTENYGTVGAGVIDCPGQDPFTTGGVPTPTVTQGNDALLIFDHEEGETITRPFAADMVTGNATWIIHVPER